MNVEKLARGLGWFSIALGLAEIIAPRKVGGWLGVPHRTALIRACGIREIASGIGILSGAPTSGWLWSRVFGDAIDLALLGSAYNSPTARRGPLTMAVANVASITALDAYCGRKLSHQPQAMSL